MKAENVFEMPRPLSVADGQPFSKEDYAAEAAILEMPQSPAAIRRSAFLELILRQIPDGVIVSDRQGTIIFANPVAKHFAQFDPEGQRLDLAQTIWGELFDGAGAHIVGAVAIVPSPDDEVAVLELADTAVVAEDASQRERGQEVLRVDSVEGRQQKKPANRCLRKYSEKTRA